MGTLGHKKVIVIIPAYNEEEKIAAVIKEVKPNVDEVVLVDDGSDDRTVELAQKQEVIVLRHLFNRGQGAALETGNQYALKQGADIIVHFDADGQFLAGEIKNIIKPIENGEAEVVLGSRFMGKKSNIPWLKKNIIFPLARKVNRLMGINLTDPQSGFRAFSRRVNEQLRIEQDGSAHCSEILNKIFYYKFTVKEISITVIYKDFGQSFFRGKGRGMGGIRIVKDLILAKLIN
jgi:glycosyltransferase involved in cell wall biosynthesis